MTKTSTAQLIAAIPLAIIALMCFVGWAIAQESDAYHAGYRVGTWIGGNLHVIALVLLGVLLFSRFLRGPR